MLTAPFPWFGGKRRVAAQVWERFGTVRNYVEPFAGSLAVLLARPDAPGIETANDKDGYVSNFWRAVAADPEAVAHYADWPVNEADLHARHQWLVQQADFRQRIAEDPEYFDAKIAGWWVWGISCWIGGSWCGERFWTDGPPNGKRPMLIQNGNGAGVHVQRTPQCKPQMFADGPGVGVHRARPSQRRPHLHRSKGVHRQAPYLSMDGWSRGVHSKTRQLQDWMAQLQTRLRNVRMLCGDWRRVLTPTALGNRGYCGVFLDPPYSTESDRHAEALYGVDDFSVAHDVAAWAREYGSDPRLRIALCGLAGEHDMPGGWTALKWSRPGGYGNQSATGVGRANAKREVIWFSPACLEPRPDYCPVPDETQLTLLEDLA